MNNRLEQLLATWQPQKESLEWVLATVVETQGSSYRKSGAMMLINSLGQYFGLISGGCLEADIMRRARRCWDTEQNQIVCYDMRDEDDLSWQLGIGCGGMVRILLQPISQANNWLELDKVFDALQNRQQVAYKQVIDENTPQNTVYLESEISREQTNEVVHHFSPAPMIAILGGGIDAIPLAAMAKTLGWYTLVIDPRVGYARAKHFNGADQIIRQPFEQLTSAKWLAQVDACVVMNHSLSLDAAAMQLVAASSCRYLGLLGPRHRTQRVFKLMQENGFSEFSKLEQRLSNPVGLDIGGELPESIALSILAEAHAVLEERSAKSLTLVASETQRDAI